MGIWKTMETALAAGSQQLAVEDGSRRFSYADLASRALGLGAFWAARGVARGDRIAILRVNSHQYIESYYAAAALGVVLCPLNIRLAPGEIASILEDSGARWLIAGAELEGLVAPSLALAPKLEGIVWIDDLPALPLGIEQTDYEQALSCPAGAFVPRAAAPDDPAHIYYTSGTTGRAKGVVLTHRNVCVHAQNAVDELGLGRSDAWGHIAPMFHLADAWATFAITAVGGKHVMVRRFDPETVLEAIDKARITISNLIPTMLNLLVKHPRARQADTSSLRLILSGGAPIAPALVRQVIEVLGCDYVQTYGMTETSPYLTLSLLKEHMRSLPKEEQLAYKCRTGRPFKGVVLKVVDESGKEVAADDQQVGEIWVRGETVTPGYWNRPEETSATFCDGWLCTGDLAVIDREGYVNIVDRKKDMIITGGENVYSTEVESVLYEHSEVLEAAVFGVPDEKWGEAVKAAVALKADSKTTADELICFCRERLAHFKAPRSIDFHDVLPRTGPGKIHKKKLRDPYW